MSASQAVIWSAEAGAYWGEDSFTRRPAQARRWERAEAERIARLCRPEKLVEVRDAEAAA